LGDAIHWPDGSRYKPWQFRTTQAWRLIEQGVELADAALKCVDGAAELKQLADCVLVISHKVNDALVVVADHLQGINGPVD
jgi:hypothetical protein